MQDRMSTSSAVIARIGMLVCAAVALTLSFQAGLRSGGAQERTVQPSGQWLKTVDADGNAANVQIQGSELTTLLLVLSVDCPHCKTNLPRWLQLLKEIEGQEDVIVVVVSKSSPERTLDYVRASGLEGKLLRWESEDALDDLSIHGTPTTAIVPPGGGEVRIWEGVLSRWQIRKIRRALLP